MRLSLIVAMTRRGVIGRAGRLPWRLSADLKRFKALTMGHHVILGRKTYESLPGPLPGRILLVMKRVSSPYDFSFQDEQGQDVPLYDEVVRARQTGDSLPTAVPLAFVHSLEEALRLADGDDEVFVIGGGEIYRQAFDRADRLYVTWVEADVAGDTCFPAWNPAEWILVESAAHPADERNEYATTFCVYERRREL